MGRIARIPVECVVIAALAGIFFALFAANVMRGMPAGDLALTSLRVFGGSFFGGGFLYLAVFAYVCLRFQIHFLSMLYRSVQGRTLAPFRRAGDADCMAFRALADALRSVMLLGFSFAFLAAAIMMLYTSADPAQVRVNSDALMVWDREIFDVYPIFALQSLRSIPFFETAIITAYRFFFPVTMAVLLLALFSRRKRLFRQFSLTLFSCFLFAFPLWFFAPAISPQDMYNRNILQIAIPDDVRFAFREAAPSAAFREYVARLDTLWDTIRGSFQATTTNPSIHVAWGIVALVYGFRLSPVLGGMLLLWFPLNFIGTVYVWQHYVMDLLTGILTAVGAMMLSMLLLQWESAYYKGSRNEAPIAAMLAGDWERMKGWYQTSIRPSSP